MKATRAEHAITIEKIAELEDRIRLKRRPRANAKPKTTLADTIYSVLPDDQTFTLDDVVGLVKSAEPERERSRATVNTNLNRLLHAGSIKRIQHATTGKPAIFAMTGYDAPGAKTMLDWAREVTDECGDIPPVEIMVRMVENGYQMEADPAAAASSLKRELKKSSRCTTPESVAKSGQRH